jgi:hypothetical protein
MSDRFDFQFFFATEKLNDPEQRSTMIRARHFLTVTETFQVGHFQARAMRYQTLRGSGCQTTLGLRIENRKLQRRTSAIDNKDRRGCRHPRRVAELSGGSQGRKRSAPWLPCENYKAASDSGALYRPCALSRKKRRHAPTPIRRHVSPYADTSLPTPTRPHADTPKRVPHADTSPP